MILDSFKLHSLVVQINFEEAFVIWDRAGALARELSTIWGRLSVNEAKPQQQVLQGDDVVVNVGLSQCVLTLFREKANVSRASDQIRRSFEAWREYLEFSSLHRISARSVFLKEFGNLDEANRFVLDLGLVKWPESQVFNQSKESGLNSIDLNFRFQDESAFTTVRVKTERVAFQADLDKEFVSEAINVEKNRVVVDFDRGTLGRTNAEKFRVDEWLKGYQHLMRRDIPKVLGK